MTRLIIWIIAAGAVLSAFLYFHQQSVKPSTDDAYVEADIIQIAAQVAGPIVNLPIKNNTAVKKGDLLFEIDPRPFQIDVDQAKAELQSTRDDVDTLTQAVETAQAGVDGAKAGIDEATRAVTSAKAELDKAQKENTRQRNLLKQGAGSKRQAESAEAAFKEARAAWNQARADLDEAQAKLRQARSELGEARARLGEPGENNASILLSKAKLADAELNLSYTKVVAVRDALVSGLNLPVGNYVTTGARLFTLVTTDTWRIGGNFLETDIARIKPGQKAVVRLQAYPAHRLEGIVEGTAWGIQQQAGSVARGGLPNVTRTVDWVRLAQRFPVKVKLVNVPAEVELRVGMNGSVQVDTTTAPPAASAVSSN